MIFPGTPRLPRAPSSYDPKKMSDLIRAIEQAFIYIANPGEGRNTGIVLTDLQDDDVALENGSLYKLGNTIKIVVPHIASVRSAEIDTSEGNVAVVIS